MKKLFLLLVALFVSSTILLHAQDNWADINFSRDSIFWGQGTTPPQPNYQLYNNRTFTNSQSESFLVHGWFGRWVAVDQVYNVENGTEQFKMAYRISKSVANQFVFPKYQNIGKIKIQFWNESNTVAVNLPIQQNTAADGLPAVWATIATVAIPFNGNSTTSFVAEQVLNLNTPTQLRLGPLSATDNVYIYSITISKSLGTGVSENMIDAAHLNLVGRTLEITNANNDYIASIYNLAGTKIGNVQKGKPFTFKTAGPYVIKIESAEKSITRKIIVI